MTSWLRVSVATIAAAGLFGFQQANAGDWYISAQGGVTVLADQDFDTGAGGVGIVDTEFDNGEALKLAVGKQMDGYRLEFEVSMREAGVDTHSAGGSVLPGSEGDADVTSFIFNALYDFDTSTSFVPYAGLGLGAGGVGIEGYTVDGVDSVVDDEDSGLAWQIILGLAYTLTDNLQLTVEYNYFSVADLEVDTDLGSNESEIDFEAHNVFAGLRYHF